MQKIMYETVEYVTIAFVLPFRLPRIFLSISVIRRPVVRASRKFNPGHVYRYSFQWPLTNNSGHCLETHTGSQLELD